MSVNFFTIPDTGYYTVILKADVEESESRTDVQTPFDENEQINDGSFISFFGGKLTSLRFYKRAVKRYAIYLDFFTPPPEIIL